MSSLTDRRKLKSERRDSVAVYYRCKICGKDHRSEVQLGNKKSFESSQLASNKFRCPNTGKSATYDKKDMLWKEET